MLYNLMKSENKKKYLIAVFWLISGYFCWFCSVYLYAFVSDFGYPILIKFITSTFHSQFIKTLTMFIYFFIIHISLAFLFAYILSRASGVKGIWLFLFIIGAIGYSLYDQIGKYEFYIDYYETLQSWATSSFIMQMIANLIIIPIAAWLGTILGNKFRARKLA